MKGVTWAHFILMAKLWAILNIKNWANRITYGHQMQPKGFIRGLCRTLTHPMWHPRDKKLEPNLWAGLNKSSWRFPWLELSTWAAWTNPLNNKHLHHQSMTNGILFTKNTLRPKLDIVILQCESWRHHFTIGPKMLIKSSLHPA